MHYRRNVISMALLLVVVVAVGYSSAEGYPHRFSIVGSLELVAGGEGFEELGLATYGAGGTTIVVNEAPPEFAKTGQGSWVRTGRRTFKSTFRVFVFVSLLMCFENNPR